jgi:hypothetical protein
MIGGFIEIHRAQTVCVAHHRDARAVLYALDKTVAPPGNNQIDIVIQFQQ